MHLLNFASQSSQKVKLSQLNQLRSSTAYAVGCRNRKTGAARFTNASPDQLEIKSPFYSRKGAEIHRNCHIAGKCKACEQKKLLSEGVFDKFQYLRRSEDKRLTNRRVKKMRSQESLYSGKGELFSSFWKNNTKRPVEMSKQPLIDNALQFLSKIKKLDWSIKKLFERQTKQDCEDPAVAKIIYEYYLSGGERELGGLLQDPSLHEKIKEVFSQNGEEQQVLRWKGLTKPRRKQFTCENFQSSWNKHKQGIFNGTTQILQLTTEQKQFLISLAKQHKNKKIFKQQLGKKIVNFMKQKFKKAQFEQKKEIMIKFVNEQIKKFKIEQNTNTKIKTNHQPTTKVKKENTKDNYLKIYSSQLNSKNTKMKKQLLSNKEKEVGSEKSSNSHKCHDSNDKSKDSNESLEITSRLLSDVEDQNSFAGKNEPSLNEGSAVSQGRMISELGEHDWEKEWKGTSNKSNGSLRRQSRGWNKNQARSSVKKQSLIAEEQYQEGDDPGLQEQTFRVDEKELKVKINPPTSRKHQNSQQLEFQRKANLAVRLSVAKGEAMLHLRTHSNSIEKGEEALRQLGFQGYIINFTDTLFLKKKKMRALRELIRKDQNEINQKLSLEIVDYLENFKENCKILAMADGSLKNDWKGNINNKEISIQLREALQKRKLLFFDLTKDYQFGEADEEDFVGDSRYILLPSKVCKRKQKMVEVSVQPFQIHKKENSDILMQKSMPTFGKVINCLPFAFSNQNA